MSAVCPVCGCKTDEIDFLNIETDTGDNIPVCDYCHKQINFLQTADTQDAESMTKIQSKVRWLDTVIEKPVEERKSDCEGLLLGIRKRFPGIVHEQQSLSVEQQAVQQTYIPPANISASVSPSEATALSNAEVEQLKKRIELLETKFYKFKRNLLLSSILEFAIPGILMVILAIIFFRSSLWSNLSNLIFAATGGMSSF